MARDLPGTKLGFIVWQSFSGLLRKENGCSVFRPEAIYRSLVSYISDWDHIIYDAKSLVSYIGDWNQGSKDAELCSGIGMQATKSVNSRSEGKRLVCKTTLLSQQLRKAVQD